MNIIKKCISRIKKKDCCLNCVYYNKCQGGCMHPTDDTNFDIINIIDTTTPLYYKCNKYKKSDNTHLFDTYINKLIIDWVKDADSKYKSNNVMYAINRKHKKITIITNIPGFMIGRRGVLRNKYNEIFEYYGYKVILLEGDKIID